MYAGKSRLFQDVGAMRRDYFLYVDEVEWCLRGIASGMRLGFNAGARVLHNQRASTGSSKALRHRPRLPIFFDERNKMLATRDGFMWKLPARSSSRTTVHSFRFLSRGAWRQFGYATAGWWAGVAN
jgi:GT2 family glycosyltransferase